MGDGDIQGEWSGGSFYLCFLWAFLSAHSTPRRLSFAHSARRRLVCSLQVTVDNYYVIDTGEDDMIEYVMSTGPLAVCVDANDWVSYTGGVIHSCGTDLDHCVQVGFLGVFWAFFGRF